MIQENVAVEIEAVELTAEEIDDVAGGFTVSNRDLIRPW